MARQVMSIHSFKHFLSLICLCLISFTLQGQANEEISELLPAEKAFILKTQTLNENEIQVYFQIEPGYLLYRKNFELKTEQGQRIEIDPNLFPLPIIKEDPIEGKYEVYAHSFAIKFPLKNKQGIRLIYQGCSESGFCFAPIAKEILRLKNNHLKMRDLSIDEFNELSESNIKQEEKTEELDWISNQLRNGYFPLTLLLFLGLGILLAFTPCILPMVPILANIIIGEEPLSQKRALFLASLYVLSVAVCYAVAGAIAGLMGNQFQVTLQQPIFLTALSFLLVLFALSQFNIIHIQLPQIFAQTLHHLQHKQKQGSAFGAIAMGSLSALMVSPCVTPALVGALTYIGHTGNAALGSLALFALAIGMGLPLLGAVFIGTHLLPKSGPWMKYTKVITGFLLLIIAYSTLVRAFPANSMDEKMAHNTHFSYIQSEKDFKKALLAAHALQKPVILDVTADWCVSCRQLDREIFMDPQVIQSLSHAKLLRLDITRSTPENALLQKALEIVGPPTILFFKPDGSEDKMRRLVGKLESNTFISHVQDFFQNTK